MMGAIVEVRHVTFAYRGGGSILNDASFSFAAGLAHGVTGPSGCGKSTLLYVAGLMLRPQSGQVLLDGTDLAATLDSTRARARAETIGFVFQDALLDTSLTVWENLIEGLPWTRRRRPQLLRCSDGLERLGLADLKHRKAGRLSGGQAQRVALVRAMAKLPTVLLADEPTGNLDPASAQIVLSELVAYGRDPGRVAIIVTHDDRVAGLCDNLVQLTPTLSKCAHE